MHIIFFNFKNELWNEFVPHAKAGDTTKKSRVFADYLSEIDYEFSSKILEKINSNDFDSLDFSAQTWWVDICKDHFEIYFSIDEDNTEFKVAITPEEFKKGIFEWNRFLKNRPNGDYSIDFKV